MIDQINYEELDPPIRELVRVLNEFSGISTLGSCGGHEDGTPGEVHAAADEWWVTMSLEPADSEAAIHAPSEQAWLDFEFLVYWISRLRAEKNVGVDLAPYAPPPHLNEPGRMLRFELRGWRRDDDGALAIDAEPDRVAAWIRDGLAELYVEGGELP